MSRRPGVALTKQRALQAPEPLGVRVLPPGRVTAATAIYNVLFDEIVGMHLLPSTPLQEKVLTNRFGVSRTPVREALIRLGEDGLVDIFRQSGTFVSKVPVGAIAEAVVIRQALEEVTIARLAAHAGTGAMERLDTILARQHTLAVQGNLVAFHEADEGFHATIAELAGLPGVWSVLKRVKVQMDRARRLTLPVPGRMAQVIGEHEVIRNAVARHDVEGARAAMRSHLSVVIPDVDRLRLQYPGYFD
jgi:GntR family transcriptional regulator, rspAB operon transcriptional repressor